MRLNGWLITLLILWLAATGTTQIQVSLPDTTADWQGQVSIPVQVTDVTTSDVYSYEFNLKYDSLILAPIEVQQTALTANWPLPVVNDETKGTLIIGGYGANKLIGKGRLVNIVFNVIGNPGDIGNLTFVYFLFNNGTPSANTVNGRVKITTNLVPVTVTSNVLDGTTLIVDGASYSAPYSAYWAIGSQHQISAPSPQTFNNNKRFMFQSWSDQGAQTHTVSVNLPTVFTAMYNTQYYLLVQSKHGNPQGSGWYDAGTTARFSVEASITEGNNTKHNFSSWSGSGTGSYSGTIREASIVMTGPMTETANWSTQYNIDIISSYGGPFGSGWYQPGVVVNFGIDSIKITRSNAHYQFLSWAGTGNGSYTGPNAKSSIAVSGPVTERANWEVEYLVVTDSYPAGILQVPGAGWYKQGQQFTSIKAPDSLIVNQIKYFFKGWKINNQIVPGNPVTVSINEAKTIIADYSTDITVIITTNVGPGTKVMVDGAEKNAPHTVQWAVGSRHSIGIASIQNGTPGIQYIYHRWSHGGQQTQDVIATVNTTYLAELETQFYLEVKTEPAGITNTLKSGWYPAMQVVKLDSLPQNKLLGQSSFRLKKWQLDGVDSTNQFIMVLMDKPHTAIAVYQQGFYIMGNITFVGSDPVPVILNVSGTENFTAQSFNDGSYLIAGLIPGDYAVTLSHPDFQFEPTNRTYHITKNEEYQYYVAFYHPSSVIPDEDTDFIPDQYQLLQNYPNPFSGETIIGYHLKQAESVNLAVYNVLGQVVQQLVDARQSAGHYRISWKRLDFQGTKVPPGVYFYRIEVGNFVQIRKMIVL